MSRPARVVRELAATLRTAGGALTATIATLAALVLQVWLPNLGLIGAVVTSDGMTLANRARFLWASLGALTTTFTVAGAVLAVVVSVLFGLHAAATVRYVRRRMATAGGSFGLAGMLAALLGAGCSACGAVLLSSVIGTAAAAAVVGALPLHGLEFSLLALATLAGTLAFTLDRLATPPACPPPLPGSRTARSTGSPLEVGRTRSVGDAATRRRS